MRNMTKAELKREQKKFRVGDVVTWGRGEFTQVVLEVRDNGLIVDATDWWGPTLLVVFDGNARWGVHHQDACRAEGTLRVVRRSGKLAAPPAGRACRRAT
jgi:hypothetical protein